MLNNKKETLEDKICETKIKLPKDKQMKRCKSCSGYGIYLEPRLHTYIECIVYKRRKR